ncbi:hypothetical protein MHBO_002230 [Bonamia ostreae]|uniref:Uncharacterized protein n=1 Tax=Bonamia ostreae TaxID=126728 RepID=A0ABV2AMF4_9EUKA
METDIFQNRIKCPIKRKNGESEAYSPLEEFIHKKVMYDPYSYLRNWWKFSVNPWGTVKSDKKDKLPLDRFIFLSLAKKEVDEQSKND